MLIEVRKLSEGFEISGSRRCERRFDPYVDDDGVERYSLVAGWDWKGDHLEFWSDRLGAIPLFVFQHDNRIVIADELAQLCLAVSDLEFDWDALSVFFRLGYFIGDDTPFSAVSVLPPSAKLSWSGSQIAIEGKVYAGPIVTCSRDDAISTYQDLFAKSVARRASRDRKICVPLSGGRDSRHILAQLAELGAAPIEVVTLKRDGRSCGEADAAVQVCQKLELSHRTIDRRITDFASDEHVKNCLTHCLTDEHEWYLGLLSDISADSELLLDGIGGDVLSNGLYFDETTLNLIKDGQISEAAKRLLPKFEPTFISSQVTPRIRYERALNRIERELARHADAPNALKSYYFWNRTRRVIALSPICLAGRRLQVCAPYLDAELLDFLIGLPAEGFGKKGFHDAVISKHYPAIQDVPYSELPPQHMSAEERRFVRRSMLRFIANTFPVPLSSKRFVLSRLARGLFNDISKEVWWARNLVYLHSLSELRSGGRFGARKRLDLGIQQSGRDEPELGDANI